MIRLFQVFLPATIVGLIVTEVLICYSVFVSAFLLLSEDDFVIDHFYEGGFERTAVVVATLILGLYFNDLYSEPRVVSRLRLYQQICLVLGLGFLGQALAGYVAPTLILGRNQMLLGSVMLLIVLPLLRMWFDHAVIRVFNREKILFIGANSLVTDIVDTINRLPQFGLESIGYLAPEPCPHLPMAAGPWLGEINDVARVCDELAPSRVVVGLEDRRGALPVNDLLRIRLSGTTRVEDATDLYEAVMWRVSVKALRPSQLLFSDRLGPRATSVMMQRASAFLIALVGVVLTAPVMGLVWLAVRLTSAGPAVYRQPRVGLHGAVFDVLKFRSMYIDAEARTGAVWAQKNDPRITPIGLWLRKLRLDELPQFFNVLKGEMAIVGPRPERPEFVKILTEKIPFYGERHAILPGITGWAQINHKYGDTMEDTITKLEYDLYYLKHLSFSLDMYIAFHTAKVMLMRKGSQ